MVESMDATTADLTDEMRAAVMAVSRVDTKAAWKEATWAGLKDATMAELMVALTVG